MPAAQPRLAIDLSNSLIRVVEGAVGGGMRCGSGGTPPGSLVGGRIVDVDGVASALRQLLARTEIRESRALIVVSDALASFRVLPFPASASDESINAATMKELPVDERMATRWLDLISSGGQRLIYAVVWDRAHVRRAADVAKAAGVDPHVVELKSVSLARTVTDPSYVFVDLSRDPAEVLLVEDHIPRLWRSYNVTTPANEDVSGSLIAPLRQVLQFYRRRSSTFNGHTPIFIGGEQAISQQGVITLANSLGHPVAPLPIPRRVPSDLRHVPYLACLGALMRRG